MAYRHPTPIYITSFSRLRHLPIDVEPFSAAVYQPSTIDQLEKADWCDIRDERGAWIRPREFEHRKHPLDAYRKRLMALYEGRLDEIQKWLSDHCTPLALCCWCPHDRAARRQLKEWGSFVCHTAVIGEFLTTNFRARVWYDSERLAMAVLTQKP